MPFVHVCIIDKFVLLTRLLYDLIIPVAKTKVMFVDNTPVNVNSMLIENEVIQLTKISRFSQLHTC